MEEQAVAKAIFHAVRAGAFRAGARTYPEAAETMLAAAEINSARVQAALSEFGSTAPDRLESKSRGRGRAPTEEDGRAITLRCFPKRSGLE